MPDLHLYTNKHINVDGNRNTTGYECKWVVYTVSDFSDTCSKHLGCKHTYKVFSTIQYIDKSDAHYGAFITVNN